MADINSMIAVGIPDSWASEIEGGSPTAATLIAFGCAPLLATEIAGSPTVESLMALGLSDFQATEVFNVLNP